MDTPHCENCANFIQHYGLCNGRLSRLHCGHCTLVRMKKKRPDSPICDHFEPGSGPEDSLVSKEYLYKELLKYTLSLELAPEISNWPEKSKPL